MIILSIRYRPGTVIIGRTRALALADVYCCNYTRRAGKAGSVVWDLNEKRSSNRARKDFPERDTSVHACEN
jgi:hypothetical protein